MSIIIIAVLCLIVFGLFILLALKSQDPQAIRIFSTVDKILIASILLGLIIWQVGKVVERSKN